MNFVVILQFFYSFEYDKIMLHWGVLSVLNGSTVKAVTDMRIAVLVCSLVFDSQKAFMKGIERRVRDWNDVCSVFCCHVNIAGNSTYVRGEYSIFDLPDFSEFDGIIFVRNTFQNSVGVEALSKRIINSGVPCICVDSYHPDFINIMSDERSLMEEVTRHLVEVHNAKRLYFLGGFEDSSDSVLRFRGFMDVLEKNNLEFKDEWKYNGNYEYSSGVEAADYFLNIDSTLPDAVVCCNDEMAVGLISEFKRRGIKVPKDVRVTGIDYDSVSRVYSPRITTGKRQQYQKGVTAINIIHELSSYSKGQTITQPINLFCGETCGCRPDEDIRSDVPTVNSLAVDRYFQSQLTQSIKRMTADLMGKRDYAALLDGLKQYACELKADELYLCMNVRPEFHIDYSDYASALSLIDRDNQEDYSDEMMTAVTVFKGESPKDETREHFSRRDLFPPVAKGGKPGGTYYFFPIHYMNRNFGYAILGTSGELIRNDFFPNWCTNASNALENNRKRDVMVQMISTLDRMWIYDTLTGIYNRAGFFKLSEPILSECVEKKIPVCVIFMDVDGLKDVNDKYGHDEGDVLIKTIADILKDNKKHGEIIMRYGGDEFVLLAAGYDDEAAGEFVSKVETAMNRFNSTGEKPYDIEASIGYCITLLNDIVELNDLIENADHEMYKKKYVKKALRNKSVR